MSPTAMGREVVPTLKRFRNGTIPGSAQPDSTPISMAVKIHSVRKRSRKPRRDTTLVLMRFRASGANSFSLAADVVQFFLKREIIERGKRKAQEQADSSV